MITVNVKGFGITIVNNKEQDYISLTDRVRGEDVPTIFEIGCETGILLNFLGYGSKLNNFL